MARDFRLLLITSFGLDLGYFLRIAAQSWLLFELTNGQLWVGLANAVRVIPIIVLSLIGGVLGDRGDRRHILFSVRTALAVVVFATAILVVSEAIVPWHLLVLNLLIGAIVSFGNIAWYQMMFDLAGKDRLWVANSMSSVVSNAGAIMGPLAAGAVMAASGPGTVYFIAAAMYLSGAIGIMAIRPNFAKAAETKTKMVAELAAGLRYVRSNSNIGWALIVAATALAHAAIHPLLPVYARDVFHRDANGYGQLFGAFGVGLFVGAALLSVLPSVKRKGVVVLVATLVWDIAMATFGVSRIFGVSLLLMFVMGFAGAYLGNALVTILQTMSSDEMRGRVMSIFIVAAEMGTVGWLAGGALAQWVGNEEALLIAAGAGTGVTVLAFIMSPALRRA